MNEQAILVRIAKDRLQNRIAALVFAVCYFKSQCRFSDAVDFRGKVPALIVEKCFAIGEKELQVAYLRSVDCGVVDLGHTTSIERVPDPTGGRICGADRELGTVCPTWLNARAARRAMCHFACHPDLLWATPPKFGFFRIRTTDPPSSKETSSISVFMR